MKYSDLVVWQKAMDLVERIYSATRTFPGEERFGLCSQMQRAAVSIPSNIAEGHGRKSTGAFLNHLSVANGSLHELETQIQIAQRLDYLDGQTANAMIDQAGEIGRMLSGLRSSLNPKS